MNYWEEVISEGACEANLVITESQIKMIASHAESAHENYGLATGSECIPNPMESEIEQLKKSHAKDKAEWESRDLNYRKSVATRRGVDVNNVYQNEHGEVMFDLS